MGVVFVPASVSSEIETRTRCFSEPDTRNPEQAVEAGTMRRGVVRRELHPHELFYKSDISIVAHNCDLCRKRVTEGYRCHVCDFDCCLDCFTKARLPVVATCHLFRDFQRAAHRQTHGARGRRCLRSGA